MAVNGGNRNPSTNGNGEGQLYRCCHCGETTADVAGHFRRECEVIAGD